MPTQQIDYLVLGSGLSALNFAALMAKANQKVLVIEAHEYPGGYGHTFVEKNSKHTYHFNAQLHYVWDCGVGEPVYQVLKKLGLEKEVEFVQYNKNGFDHMYMPNHSLQIPNSYQQLLERLCTICPQHHRQISRFISRIKNLSEIILERSRAKNKNLTQKASVTLKSIRLLPYYGATLQQVFDKYQLPKTIQTLLASQWPDFLLPPNQLYFYCWLVLFDGYIRGAYYPKKHFEHVVNALVNVISQNSGEVLLNQTVTDLIINKGRVLGAKVRDSNDPTVQTAYYAKNIICNMDPKQTAHLIGLDKFSASIRKKLNYDYSYSNFMVYGAVEGIDLRDYGFGNWNVFHNEHQCINHAFKQMHDLADYKDISFAFTTPSLVSEDSTGCPEGQQLFELLTVANYDWFKQLKYRNNKQYIQQKKAIYNRMIEVIERDYVPDFGKHVCFKMLGSPTTNESYCLSPAGNSYGANMTPKNMGLFKLNHNTSLKNFYFCNASSGFAGFAKSFSNAADLYQRLTGDIVL